MTGLLLYMVPFSFVGLTATLPRNNIDAWRRRFIEALAAGTVR
jgi:hypothetical protein